MNRNRKWKKIALKVTIWLVAEVYLNFLGLDNMADYSEFIFERDAIVFNG